MKTLVELAYEKKQTFINIVKSFGCNSSYAEDIVQELFIQIHLDVKKGLDLWYNDDINTYYCYKVLRGIYLNTHKKQARFLKTYIEDIEEIKQAEDLGIDEIEYAKSKDIVDDILKEMYWYDSKVFSLVASGKSVASLSRDTKISYYSLYNTYRTALKNIKEQI
jgi:DNA-directed RNA polymerase specialized sigma24 family protein